MQAAIAAWPGPDGAAARKARIFTSEQIDIAIAHLVHADPL
jgi:hypothetical protein